MDPLSSVLALLRPEAAGWNVVEAYDAFSIRFPARSDAIVFWQLLSGQVNVEINQGHRFKVTAGDFILMASPTPWTMWAGSGGPEVKLKDLLANPEQLRFAHLPKTVTQIVAGYYIFAPAGADLLGRLMLPVVHVRAADLGADRLGLLLKIFGDEALVERAGRAHVLQHLLQLILVEALRQPEVGWQKRSAGLLNGLADRHINKALHLMHAVPSRPLTVAALARAAGLSRSSFAARFAMIVGMSPIDYLSSWRMALARDALENGRLSMTETAELAGYQSVSAFSTAFRRHAGVPPTAFQRARAHAAWASDNVVTETISAPRSPP